MLYLDIRLHGRFRIGIQQGRRTECFHVAALEQKHGIGHALGLFAIMRYPDAGKSTLADDGLQQQLNAALAGFIEGGCGLIEQQQLRLIGQSAGDGDALGLTARKRLHPAAFIAGQPYLFQQCANALGAVALVMLCRAKCNVPGNRSSEQVGPLHHHANATAQLTWRQGVAICFAEEDGAGGGFVQPVQQPQQGAFTRAARPQHGQHCSGRDLKAGRMQQRFFSHGACNRDGTEQWCRWSDGGVHALQDTGIVRGEWPS